MWTVTNPECSACAVKYNLVHSSDDSVSLTFAPFLPHIQTFNVSIIFLMIFIPCFNIATIFAGFLPGLLDSSDSVCFHLLFSYFTVLYDFVSYPFLYSLKLCPWPPSYFGRTKNQKLLGLMWFAFPAVVCLIWKFSFAFAISLSALKHNRVSVYILLLTSSSQFKVLYKMGKEEAKPE